ncbi:MAG TPA: hypothetical protein DEB74_13610 [Lachnospiraceae bacterium]|nr:hypothetical protein [Lachnospiraceae bacterium]
MKYLENEAYCSDIKKTIEHSVDFSAFFNKKVLILGASGLIGSFITDCFLYANKMLNAEIMIYAVSRNIEQLKKRFEGSSGNNFNLIQADVCSLNNKLSVDYIIHAASYGHPQAFRETPVEVLLSNVLGTHKVLEIARQNIGCRVLYVSSGEVQEQVEHLSVRACYPIGKKAAETLCISYQKEYGVNVVIARPCHTFGANMTETDNRATAQFLKAAAKGIDIKMYSEGKQRRSFSYVADCVSGLLTVLADGTCGTVYGISSGEYCTVNEFADRCANVGKCKVELHKPTDNEKAEVSPIKKQIVDNDKLKGLGWNSVFSISEGIQKSIQIINEMSG